MDGDGTDDKLQVDEEVVEKKKIKPAKFQYGTLCSKKPDQAQSATLTSNDVCVAYFPDLYEHQISGDSCSVSKASVSALTFTIMARK